MPSRDDPYSRVYHRFSDEFPSVFDDDRAVAAWLRLLLIADAAWPTRPPIPATVNRKALSVLQGAGLVVVERGYYTMLGLDKQRTERRDKAVSAGLARVERALSTSSTKAQPRQTEHRQTEPSNGRAKDGLPNLTDSVSGAWEDATGRSVLSSGEFAIGYLDDACRRHPDAAVITAIREARSDFERIPTTQQLTVAVRSLLDPLPDAKAVAAAESSEDEQRRHAKAVQRTVLATHERGAHQDDPDPRCPECKTAGVA
jgi:hypothetical protein